MATATRVPVEVYLRSSYEPDAEYVDGEIEERSVGENDHFAWQNAIGLWFNLHGQEWRVRVRPELRIQVAPTRFRVPDVTVLDRAQPTEQIVPPRLWQFLRFSRQRTECSASCASWKITA
jgi:hypothetical protein